MGRREDRRPPHRQLLPMPTRAVQPADRGNVRRRAAVVVLDGVEQRSDEVDRKGEHDGGVLFAPPSHPRASAALHWPPPRPGDLRMPGPGPNPCMPPAKRAATTT